VDYNLTYMKTFLKYINKNFLVIILGSFFLFFGYVNVSYAECYKDTECPNGYFCQNPGTTGLCVTKAIAPHSINDGDSCSADLQCQEGSGCVSGICKISSTGNKVTCSNNNDCGVGSYCSSSRVCDKVTEGVSCASNPSICQTSKTGLSCDPSTKKCSAYISPPVIENNLPDYKCNSSATFPQACTSTGGSWTERYVCECKNSSNPATCNSSAASMDTCIASKGFWVDMGACSCTGINNSIPPNSAWCNNDPNLVYSNGVCLPKEATACNKDSLACTSTLTEGIVKVIKLLLTLSGMISVLFLIIGGFWYMTSAGNEEQAEKGKNTITNFFLGLVIIILSYAVVTIVSNLFTQGK
jgi:hypothetical protein